MNSLRSFVYAPQPSRIVFGRGTIAQTGDEIALLGARRALVLSTPQQKADAEALSDRLGNLSAGVFSGATMHTPVDVTERAMEVFSASGADCVVSLGGGSTIGLGKAIASRNDTPQVALPTTYAGSEVTPILGETENQVKKTRRGSEILPEVVIYDPDLSDGLPAAFSVTSGLNAMAHAAEGFYARDGNPISRLMALEGLRALKQALPAIVADPADRQGRDNALFGSWLCGTVLGAVGMSIHHKLCHVLGGGLDLPHAETHAILLPHTIAFVEEAVPDELAPVAALFGGHAGAGLFDFAQSVDAPTRLADLGVEEMQLDAMADLATKDPYWSPRPLQREAIRALLQDALVGRRP